MATRLESILRTDHKAVDKRDEVHTVMGWIAGETSKVPLVMDGAQPFGILNERAMASRRIDMKSHIDQYTTPTRALPATATVDEAAPKLAEFRAAHLPVADARGKLAGYVRALDVAVARNGNRTARDLCVPVAKLTMDQTLGDALHLFAQEYVPVLPVMGKDGRVEGVLPRRSLLIMETESSQRGRKDAGGERYHYLQDAVSGFVDASPVTVRPDASLAQVVAALDESGYALVMEKGALVGVLACETLLRAG